MEHFYDSIIPEFLFADVNYQHKTISTAEYTLVYNIYLNKFQEYASKENLYQYSIFTNKQLCDDLINGLSAVIDSTTFDLRSINIKQSSSTSKTHHGNEYILYK